MTNEAEDALVLALVNLTEALDQVNASLRRQAEERLDQPLLPITEVTILAALLRRRDATSRSIAVDTGLSTPAVQAGFRSLERRGLVTSVGRGPAATPTEYRVTDLGRQLRDRAREYSAHHMRYALSGVGSADRATLETATTALNALSVALGWQDADPGGEHGH